MTDPNEDRNVLVSPVYRVAQLPEGIADLEPDLAPMFQFAAVGDRIGLDVYDHETGETSYLRFGTVVAAWTRP